MWKISKIDSNVNFSPFKVNNMWVRECDNTLQIYPCVVQLEKPW